MDATFPVSMTWTFSRPCKMLVTVDDNGGVKAEGVGGQRDIGWSRITAFGPAASSPQSSSSPSPEPVKLTGARFTQEQIDYIDSMIRGSFVAKTLTEFRDALAEIVEKVNALESRAPSPTTTILPTPSFEGKGGTVYTQPASAVEATSEARWSWGDSYKLFGEALEALFPDGWTLDEKRIAAAVRVVEDRIRAAESAAFARGRSAGNDASELRKACAKWARLLKDSQEPHSWCDSNLICAIDADALRSQGKESR